MKTQELEDVELARSAVTSAGDIVGAKWTPLLIHELGSGTRRFRELERACEGMSTRTLADRLRALELAGVVARHSYPESPPRVEYQLTEKGRALLPIIREMRKFGTNWVGSGRAHRGHSGETSSALRKLDASASITCEAGTTAAAVRLGTAAGDDEHDALAGLDRLGADELEERAEGHAAGRVGVDPGVLGEQLGARADPVLRHRRDGAARDPGRAEREIAVPRVADGERLARSCPGVTRDSGRSSAHAIATGVAAFRLRAEQPRRRAPVQEAELGELGEPLRQLGEQRARGDRADDGVGRLAAELLRDLVRDRLRAFDCEGVQVPLQEAPREEALEPELERGGSRRRCRARGRPGLRGRRRGAPRPHGRPGSARPTRAPPPRTPTANASPRLPRDAQQRVVSPNAPAAATALAASRSLNDRVGFADSSFRWRSIPSAAESVGARNERGGAGHCSVVLVREEVAVPPHRAAVHVGRRRVPVVVHVERARAHGAGGERRVGLRLLAEPAGENAARHRLLTAPPPGEALVGRAGVKGRLARLRAHDGKKAVDQYEHARAHRAHTVDAGVVSAQAPARAAPCRPLVAQGSATAQWPRGRGGRVVTEFQRYLAEEVAEDHADGLVSRREALRRLGLLGVSGAAAASLLAGIVAEQAKALRGRPASGPRRRRRGRRCRPARSCSAGREDGGCSGAWARRAAPRGGVLVIHENRASTTRSARSRGDSRQAATPPWRSTCCRRRAVRPRSADEFEAMAALGRLRRRASWRT